jgi:hypothetical protein
MEIIGTVLRCESSRHFRNKKRGYLKDRINELAVNNMKKKSATCREELINID